MRADLLVVDDHYVSVLNREPMGMKQDRVRVRLDRLDSFSAQPRADGDEAVSK